MKYLIAFILTIYSFTSSGQTYSIDKGEGDYNKLGKAVTILKLIEQGKATDIYPHLSDKIKIDTVQFESFVRQINEIHPYQKGLWPPAFIDSNSSQLWYSRTYLEQISRDIKYQIQVYIQLIEMDETLKVSEIEFRIDDQIRPITKEIEELKNVDENDAPPPPPGPTGMN